MVRRHGWAAAPNLAQSHKIRGAFDTGNGAVNGVILTNGNRFGGVTLYVKDGELVYETNYVGRERERLVARLPAGTVHFEVRFKKDQPGPFGGGQGQILINDQPVAEHRFTKFPPGEAFGSFGIGRSHGGPVSDQYNGSFPFTGKLAPITIVIGNE